MRGNCPSQKRLAPIMQGGFATKSNSSTYLQLSSTFIGGVLGAGLSLIFSAGLLILAYLELVRTSGFFP